MIEAGITMSFSQKFYDAYQADVMSYLTQSLNGMELKDTSPEFSLGLPKVIFDITEQRLLSFKANDSSTLEVAESHPYLVFGLYDIDLEFQMKYNMYSKPEWVKDNGYGKITIKGLNISMNIIPYAREGKLMVNFTPAAEILMADYIVDLTGTTDFSKSFSFLL